MLLARDVMPIVIDRLREDLRAASGRWRAGTNTFTSMTSAERRAYLAYDPGPDELSLQRREAVSRLTRAQRETVPPQPVSVDLRAHEEGARVPHVPGQTADGMRHTIATVITTTLRTQRPAPRLEVDLPSSDAMPRVGRAWLADASRALCVREGNRLRGEVSVVRWHELHTRSAMRQWLATRGALLAVFAVHEDFFAYTGGVYHYIAGPLEGGHCAAVVGYGVESWLAQNTWGLQWGEQGYFRIAFGERGIDASMWGVELRWLDG